MRSSSVGLSIGLLLAGAAAAAQEPQNPGPQSPPNINYGGNPTAPAQLPSTYTSDPNAPTYPSGNNGPASRGGTIGDDPDKRKDAPDPTNEKGKKLERERALPEPNSMTHTGTAPGNPVSPGLPADENVEPGAVQGGPQP